MTSCNAPFQISKISSLSVSKFARLTTCLFFLATASLSYADIFEARQLLSFADSLFNEEDYKNAIHEYKRYLFLYPDSPIADEVQFRIATCYRNAGDLNAAILAYQAINNYQSIPKVRLKIAESYLFQGKYPEALELLRQFVEKYPAHKLAPRAEFLIGASYMELKNWKLSSQSFRRVLDEYPQSTFATVSGNLAKSITRADNLPHRSPLLSGLMSTVVPGGGQMYSGRFSDGLYALMVIATTTAGTIYYISQERYKIAIPLGIVSAIFYAGNIYGGIQSARIFNVREKTQFLNELRAQIRQANVF
ncbi:MAG: tol-pal system YbgF family protein [Candidatus Poribacteria bacterium]